MKKVILTIVPVLVFSFFSLAKEKDNGSKSATHSASIKVEDFALLDIEGPGGSTAISLQPTTPDEAGLGITFDEDSKDDNLWLNYSSVVASGKTRKVTAKVDGTLPTGLDLMLKTDSYSGDGKGKNGQVSSDAAQKLTGSETEILKEIGSCYTGDGTKNGHNLEYSLRLQDNDADNYQNLQSGTYNITVTYTISD